MPEADVVQILREHLEGLFPKVCPNCGRRFDSLRDYLLGTTQLGSVVSYDAEMGQWQPVHPLGILAFSSCACGTTLALSSQGMALGALWSLLAWARTETRRRGVTPQALLNDLRDEICLQVLASPVVVDRPLGHRTCPAGPWAA